MNVWAVDFDGKMENLALMRVSNWHKQQGHSVILKRLSNTRQRKVDIAPACPPLFDRPGKVYVSCLFRWNAVEAKSLQLQWGDACELGGTGVDILKALPEPMATCEPDYDLYGKDRAVGFISRGCPNRCPWCVVWRKEGQLNYASSAQHIVGDRAEAIFLDNNFLALPGHENELRWLAEQGTAIDFNQGLDVKYVTPENAALMARCNWLAGPRFAMDADSREPVVERALAYLSEAGIKPGRIMLYILIGFHGLESDVRRLLKAREWGVWAYPMGFRDLDTGDEPARGWDRRLYKKFRRLIIRLPHATTVWEDFEKEVVRA